MDALTIPLCAHGQGACIPPKLNVRDTPSGSIVGQLTAGQPVTIWASDAGWLIVQADNGLTGWAAEQYIKIEGALIP